jgi:hypothetical protein
MLKKKEVIRQKKRNLKIKVSRYGQAPPSPSYGAIRACCAKENQKNDKK